MRITRFTSWISTANHPFLIMIIAVLFVLSYLLQQVVYFSADVSWLTEASRRLLHGGTYTRDFFENNPPLILYLYLPAALLIEFTQMNSMLALHLYIGGLILFSLMMSYLLGKKIFLGKDRYLFAPIIASLALVLLLVPNRDFGQREHLLYLFTFPYMLLLAARINKVRVGNGLSIFIGVVAALGFFLKPYFLLTLCVLECYYMLRIKSWQSWSRPEIRAMMAVLLIYLLVVYMRHGDYLTFVMPYSVSWCMVTDHLPLAYMVNNGLDAFYLITACWYLYSRSRIDCAAYTDILLLSALTYYVVFVLEMNTWTYHLYPALASLLLLLSTIFVQRAYLPATLGDKVAMSLYAIGLVLIFHYYSLSIWTSSILFSKSFLFYFGVQFICYMAVYLWLNKAEMSAVRLAVLGAVLVCLVSAVMLDVVSKSAWSLHQFLIMTTLSLILYGLLIVKLCRHALSHVVTFFVMTIAFCLPAYMIRTNIDRAAGLKNGVADLVAFLQKEAVGKSVNIFTMELSYAFPLLAYGGDVQSASRFSMFIGLGGMVTKGNQYGGDGLFLTNMVAEDIDLRRPDYVFVDNRPNMIGRGMMKNGRLWIEGVEFDYLSYFKKNDYFKRAWQHYAFLKTINRFDIYRRIS